MIEVIGHIETDFPEKFGVPRQSSLAPELKGRIVFEPEYRKKHAILGLDDYDFIWLIWGFSKVERAQWSETVRPPKLGGNKRMGVFATRSPFRPNALGLSSVHLDEIVMEEGLGPVLYISGIDMMNQTPLYDIKPYLPFVDSHPQAQGGFASEKKEECLRVNFPQEYLSQLPEKKREAAIRMLSLDPRPAYQSDEIREYGVSFAGYNLHFHVKNGVLLITSIEKQNT